VLSVTNSSEPSLSPGRSSGRFVLDQTTALDFTAGIHQLVGGFFARTKTNSSHIVINRPARREQVLNRRRKDCVAPNGVCPVAHCTERQFPPSANAWPAVAT